MSTIFGPDISSYQAGLDLSRLAAASFVIAKTTEGTYYTDADYQGWRRQAANLGKPFVWYHFLSGEDLVAQVAHTMANLGDTSLPGMLDAEPAGNFHPTWGQIIGYIDAAHAAGLNLRLLYLPRWYWDQIGRPDLSVLADRRVYLVSSSYPGGTGGPAALYPGDGAAGWQSYGGAAPLLYQFTNQASDGGQPLDYNAFRGSLSQFLAYLQPAAQPAPTPTPSTPSLEDDMPVFATGEVKPGANVTTMILPPPANAGSAGWGNVWLSFGADMDDVHLRVATLVHGDTNWRVQDNFLVPRLGDRVNPWGGPLPPGTQRVSVTRVAGSENVPCGWLIEAVHR